MKAVLAILRAIVALFISDGLLTLAILGIVAVAALLLKATGSNAVAAVALVGGCLAALTLSVWRSTTPLQIKRSKR